MSVLKYRFVENDGQERERARGYVGCVGDESEGENLGKSEYSRNQRLICGLTTFIPLAQILRSTYNPHLAVSNVLISSKRRDIERVLIFGQPNFT